MTSVFFILGRYAASDTLSQSVAQRSEQQPACRIDYSRAARTGAHRGPDRNPNLNPKLNPNPNPITNPA